MNLPEGFIRYISLCGAPQFNGLIDALQSSQPEVSVRFNRLRGIDVPEGDSDIVPWCSEAIYLPRRFPFTFDPAMHQGLFYVQDASSMFVNTALKYVIEYIFDKGSRPLTILDACAAPGGKTGCAASVLPPESLIVANEFSAARCDVLIENICKSGYPHTIVTRCDATQFAKLPDTFDIILLDAPCSGEGMMRKEPVAVEQWSESLIADCAVLQNRLVANLWKALRPGGVMIYSTCTFNRSEDEEIAEFIATQPGAVPVVIPTDPEWRIDSGIDTDLPCLRFIPGHIRGEGLFMTVFRKDCSDTAPDTDSARSRRPKRASDKSPLRHSLPPKSTARIAEWILSAEPLVFFEGRDMTISVLCARYKEIVEKLDAASIPIVMCGKPVAEIKGKDLIPTQQLALDLRLNQQSFHSHEVTPEQAIAFLRRESLSLPAGIPRGFILLTYKSHPLGFVKNIGNRANNLYPKSWRVLSGHQPESLCDSISSRMLNSSDSIPETQPL